MVAGCTFSSVGNTFLPPMDTQASEKSWGKGTCHQVVCIVLMFETHYPLRAAKEAQLVAAVLALSYTNRILGNVVCRLQVTFRYQPED